MPPRDRSTARDALLLFLVAFVVYFFTSPGATGYDQYSLFADALLRGRLSLDARPPHLEMAEYQGLAYFTNPPTPTILLLPFIWIGQQEPLRAFLVKLNGGWSFPFGAYQTALSIILGSLNVALARIALSRARLSRKAANWGAVLFGFGTIVWYHSTIGSVWYLAQIVHGTAMLLLVVEWLGKARPALMGLWLAAAFWSRMETLVATPFLFVTLTDKWLHPRTDELIPRPKIGWLVKFFAPVVAVILLEFLYNYVRYGSIENYGYRMLIEKPEVRGMFPHGLFSWRYAPNHFNVLFQSMPIMEARYPWFMPKLSGTAIWITTPAFVWALFAPWDRLTAACWLGITLFLAVLFWHCGTGMTQVGYRFAMDFYSLLVILTMRGMDRPSVADGARDGSSLGLVLGGVLAGVLGVLVVRYGSADTWTASALAGALGGVVGGLLGWLAGRSNGVRWWHTAFIAVSVAINGWFVYTTNILQIGRLW